MKEPLSTVLEGKLIACLCEGTSEQAYMDILLDHNCLNISRSHLLEREPLRARNIKSFEEQYLGKSFKQKIVILRILDSKNENFSLKRLKKVNQNRVEAVINILTIPEIEMLLICAEDKYGEYEKFRQRRKGTTAPDKPSAFCKEILRLHDCKSERFIKRYFSDPEKLVHAIKVYVHVKGNQSEYNLGDLLSR